MPSADTSGGWEPGQAMNTMATQPPDRLMRADDLSKRASRTLSGLRCGARSQRVNGNPPSRAQRGF